MKVWNGVVAKRVFLGVCLDAPALIAHINEHGFAHVAVGGDPARDRNPGIFRQFTRGKLRPRLPGAGVGREFVFERENALGFKRFELGAALFNQ